MLTRLSAVSSNLLKMFAVTLLLLACTLARGQDWSLSDNPELARYFENEVAQLEEANELTQIQTLDAWQRERTVLRKQLFDMLGLAPMPDRSPLNAKITGTTQHPEFTVERLHFESLPGLYVTGNLYLPRSSESGEHPNKLPTILYVCGHGKVKEGDISYGNKVHYQHHGAWFARNGYACLTIDTLQLGEIEGVHHGTYRYRRWWWNSRGYTPAGVEAWNCIRALDYLESRLECDMRRVGVTGRSGGGIYSWWLAALDDRVQCAVPVAGITSLRDQVVHGCVEGHCDCMFMVNTFRWNFAKVAALVAPRPLLISNTDKDSIFPLEGVLDIHRQVRHIYRLHGAEDQLGLQITEGPHADTQELHIHAFRWFNRFLRGDQDMIEKTAVRFFTPEQLRVFDTLPTQEINTRIDQLFVPLAETASQQQALDQQADLLERYKKRLLERCFRAWPDPNMPPHKVSTIEPAPTPSRTNVEGRSMRKTAISFESQPHVPLRLDIWHPPNRALNEIEAAQLVVNVGPEVETPFIPTSRDITAQFVVRPGVSPWKGNEKKLTQIRRRFQLIGTTLESMQVWDIRRALQVLRGQCPKLENLTLKAGPGTESLVLLATLYEPPVQKLIVPNLATSSEQLPSILNLTRTMPAELLPLLAARKHPIVTASAKEQHPLADAVTSHSAWTGKTIRFSEAN